MRTAVLSLRDYVRSIHFFIGKVYYISVDALDHRQKKRIHQKAVAAFTVNRPGFSVFHHHLFCHLKDRQSAGVYKNRDIAQSISEKGLADSIVYGGGFGNHEIIYALHKNGYLYNPDKEEQKRICTCLWEK